MPARVCILADGADWCPAVPACVVFSVPGSSREWLTSGSRRPSAAGGALVHRLGSARLVGRPASVRVRSILAGGGGTFAERVLRCPRWGVSRLASLRRRPPEASGAAARRRLSRATPEPGPRPVGDDLYRRAHAAAVRQLRESRIHREAPPAVQVDKIVSLAAPYCRATSRRRVPRRHAVSCCVVFAADAIQRGRRTRGDGGLGRRGASYASEPQTVRCAAVLRLRGGATGGSLGRPGAGGSGQAAVPARVRR